MKEHFETDKLGRTWAVTETVIGSGDEIYTIRDSSLVEGGYRKRRARQLEMILLAWTSQATGLRQEVLQSEQK